MYIGREYSESEVCGVIFWFIRVGKEYVIWKSLMIFGDLVFLDIDGFIYYCFCIFIIDVNLVL